MDDTEFRAMENALRSSPIPCCPKDLDQNILRNIRLSRSSEKSPGAWLGEWLPRPAFLLATLSVAVASSLATTMILSHAMKPESIGTARLALGFDSFADPFSLPTDHP